MGGVVRPSTLGLALRFGTPAARQASLELIAGEEEGKDEEGGDVVVGGAEKHNNQIVDGQ